MSRRVGFIFPVIAGVVLTAALGAQAGCHVRIVRLSYVDGQVQLEQGDQGLNRAI